MAEIDVAKQWKAYIVSALGMTLIHTETNTWLRGCGNSPKGDSLSPRQSFASRYSPSTKGVK